MDKPLPPGFGSIFTPAASPPGLEYLTYVDQVLIHQRIELAEAILGCECSNQYEVKNSMGQLIYNVKEVNDCCTRNCCGRMRPFEMQICDLNEREVIHLKRPLRCTSCCCPCCQQEIEIEAPLGITLGYVKQDWHPYLPKFSILGPTAETILQVEGPFCTISCCGDVEFPVLGSNGRQIGSITKQRSGAVKECCTDTDNFGIQFPMDLDVKMKAVLMGASFLIDFMFFERGGGGGQDLCVW